MKDSFINPVKFVDNYYYSYKVYKSAVERGQIANYDIEVSYNLLHNEREIYNLLDFIGDIGGLLDGLTYIG